MEDDLRDAVLESDEKVVPMTLERSGKCQRCGQCCTKVVMNMRYSEDLRDYMEWLSLHKGFKVAHDRATGRVDIEVSGKCRYLRRKHGKAHCAAYENRPKICRDFPLNPEAAEGCEGFFFKPVPVRPPASRPK